MKRSKKKLLLENYYLTILLGYIPIIIIEYLINGSFPIEGVKFRYIENTFIFILFCGKDLIHSRYNFGKVKILTNKDETPKKYLLILRNIFILIWPLDVIPLFLFNKRFGDIIFKTKVCE